MVTAGQRITEVSDEDASPKVKAIYDDIKSTLRVPVVDVVFRLLASYPYFLEVAWRGLKPNMQIMYTERCTDELRALAVDRAAALGRPPVAPDAATSALHVFNYANPKVLIAVQALRAAATGQAPKLEELTRDEKRQIVSGVPQGASIGSPLRPDDAPAVVGTLFSEIQTTLGTRHVSSEYLALAQWPDYLQSAWAALKPIVTIPEYRRIALQLRRRADEFVLTLPYRIEATPHVMRHAGLSESDIDGVRLILDSASAVLPGSVLTTAFLAAGAGGAEGAKRNPFPPEYL